MLLKPKKKVTFSGIVTSAVSFQFLCYLYCMRENCVIFMKNLIRINLLYTLRFIELSHEH